LTAAMAVKRQNMKVMLSAFTRISSEAA